MKKVRFIPILAAGLFCLPLVAQPNNPTNPVPLDGGISVLAAAGLAYAANRIKKFNKHTSNDAQS